MVYIYIYITSGRLLNIGTYGYKEDYTISWNILAKARAYTNATKRCNLCITEKFFILSNPQMATLNKRNELISNCRHRRKYILKYC